MAKYIVKILIGTLFLWFLGVFVSCDRENPHFAIIQGNYAYSRGDYQSALVHYLKTNRFEEYEPWFSYNIGNVYHALGESDAALDMWNKATNTQNNNLLFRTSFNIGVLYYEQGKYQKAYEKFTYALTIRRDSLEAKKNLELAMEKLKATQQKKQNEAMKQEQQELLGSQEQAQRILDYVRRKENQQWSSTVPPAQDAQKKDW